MVVENDADALPLVDLDGGSGTTPVVAPDLHGLEGHDLALDMLSHQIEHLDSIFEFERKGRHVGRDDRLRDLLGLKGCCRLIPHNRLLSRGGLFVMLHMLLVLSARYRTSAGQTSAYRREGLDKISSCLIHGLPS